MPFVSYFSILCANLRELQKTGPYRTNMIIIVYLPVVPVLKRSLKPCIVYECLRIVSKITWTERFTCQKADACYLPLAIYIYYHNDVSKMVPSYK